MNVASLARILSIAFSVGAASMSPYPPSPLIQSMTWHWETYRTAAPGSDLWPVAWADDGNLYTAWGDGGGFGGSDQDGRVAMGIGRIEGGPESFRATNVNGGKNPEHPGSFPEHGKTAGLSSVDGVLYAWLNTENGKWPDVDFRLAWSLDHGATWKLSPWSFPKGGFKPATFLSFGRDYSGVPHGLRGYVYCYGFRQGDDAGTYLARVRRRKIGDRLAYEFLCGFGPSARPLWTSSLDNLHPIFIDPRGGQATVSYVPVLKRYLLTSFHSGPGQLGVFDSPQPWGPWSVIAYDENWAGMGSSGEGLTCSFPLKWMSEDGLDAWCVFSAYGQGAREGINAHDRFNLVRVSFVLRSARDPARLHLNFNRSER